MTEASQQALVGLRDLSTLEWYVIPLLALVFHVYTKEVQRARRDGDWGSVIAGATVFGMDFFNETWNGWVFHLTGRSAFWTAPGPTALRTMVGWNIEIMFMFAISGLVFWNTLSDDPKKRLFGLPERWAVAIGYSAFCVFIECLLNIGGHLVWEYPFWNRSFGGVWLIFLFGYFHFYVAAILVNGLASMRHRLYALGGIYGVAVLMNVIGLWALEWTY